MPSNNFVPISLLFPLSPVIISNSDPSSVCSLTLHPFQQQSIMSTMSPLLSASISTECHALSIPMSTMSSLLSESNVDRMSSVVHSNIDNVFYALRASTECHPLSIPMSTMPVSSPRPRLCPCRPVSCLQLIKTS